MQLRKVLASISVEPAMLAFMLTFSIKTTVFQELLYDKVCHVRFPNQPELCGNLSLVHDNKQLQEDENRIYWISSLSSLIPSIVTTLVLGSLSDTWNTKISLLVPFIGLVLADINYILQTAAMHWHPYWLLVSDVVFGCCGGLSSILGLLFAYGMKQSAARKRGLRTAVLENCTAIGTALGAAISGFLRHAVGYVFVFVVLLIVHLLIVVHLIAFTENLCKPERTKSASIETIKKDFDTSSNSTDAELTITQSRFNFAKVFKDFWQVLSRPRPQWRRLCVWLLLVAITLESLADFGINDVIFSFLRYKLAWSDLQYGWFRSLQQSAGIFGLSLIFPLLKKKFKASDFTLTVTGLIGNVFAFSMLALISSNIMAYLIAAIFVFFDIPITGLRALASSVVNDDEQGTLCSTIALMISLAAGLSSLLYNAVIYQQTLNFFPGTSFLVCAGLLIVALAIVLVFRRLSPTGGAEIGSIVREMSLADASIHSCKKDPIDDFYI